MDNTIEYSGLTVDDVKDLLDFIDSTWKEYCYTLESTNHIYSIYKKLQTIIDLDSQTK